MIRKDSMLERAADSEAMLQYWDLTDTLVDGIEALRIAGEKYLPKFPAEENTNYKFRLNQTTVMTNIFADIVESLSVKPFEREVMLVGDNVPQAIVDFSDDVDGSGNNLSVFSSNVFYNSVKSGIDWIFIDYPTIDPTIVTLADSKQAGLRPFWTHILGRNVLEARSKFIRSKEQLVYVRIYEPGKVDHVRIIERSFDGIVSWTLYQKTDIWNEVEKTYFMAVDAGVMTIDEIPMVPFMTGRRDGKSFKFDPPLRAAADLQVHLYRQESGLNYATTLTAYPMLTGNGVKPDKDESGKIKQIPVGPNCVLYAPPNADGTVGSWRYVEPSSNSLTFLSNYIKEIILNLRELGRQPLTASSSNLTTVTTAFAAGKSKSSVKAWAIQLKDALENAYRITAKWMSVDYQTVVNVFTEFDEFVDGKDYDALSAARKNGDLSRETFWEECKRRGLLSDQFNPEREEERLLAELPGDGPDSMIDNGTNDPNNDNYYDNTNDDRRQTNV